MTKLNKEILGKVAVAMADPVDDVPVPTRVRSSSFASMLCDLRIGDSPLARVLPVEVVDITQHGDMRDALNAAKDRLRNNVQSSINQAKRREDGAGYSVECKEQLFDSGVFVVALVRRTA